LTTENTENSSDINRLFVIVRSPDQVGGQARPDNPPFDRLRVTIVMVSLSNHGFPDRVGE
ncbi:MAG: hypothetical protein COT35_12105, partial [Nitrospirae bacterium CG08_land_8_20_14_0_20_52_24]